MMYNITASINFQDEATRDELWEILKKYIPKMVKGHSQFSRHTCFHDEEPARACKNTEQIVVE